MDPTSLSALPASRARCPLCGSFLVALWDPGARETLGCPNPVCHVDDDPSDWLVFEE
ncbi:MAG TPA: hypothetical protein VJN50_00650 [Actinomycetota bacterium]|nr:hypothetical protein [Actinomycetota bacterium]